MCRVLNPLGTAGGREASEDLLVQRFEILALRIDRAGLLEGGEGAREVALLVEEPGQADVGPGVFCIFPEGRGPLPPEDGEVQLIGRLARLRHPEDRRTMVLVIFENGREGFFGLSEASAPEEDATEEGAGLEVPGIGLEEVPQGLLRPREVAAREGLPCGPQGIAGIYCRP